MANHAESTMTKSTAPVKPLAVRLVEGQALAYVVVAFIFAVVSLVGIPLVWNCSSVWESSLAFICLLCPIALPIGMYIAVRKGRFAWFLLPNCATLLPLLFIGIVRTRFSEVDVYPILIIFILFVAPIILLSLPASRRWAKEGSANCKKSHRGCLFVVSILWMLIIAGMFVGGSSVVKDHVRDEQIVAEYVSGDCKVIKCLRSGNATVGFYHVFYGCANGTTNLLLISRARNLEPECKWVKMQTAIIEPLAPSDVVRVTQDLPYIKCSSTNNGTALCVEFHMQKGDL